MVDLPAPDRPHTAVTLPSGNIRDKSSRTTWSEIYNATCYTLPPQATRDIHVQVVDNHITLYNIIIVEGLISHSLYGIKYFIQISVLTFDNLTVQNVFPTTMSSYNNVHISFLLRLLNH